MIELYNNTSSRCIIMISFLKYTNNQSLIFSWLAQFNEFELHLMLSHKAKREAKTVSLRSWWFATV
jgi:hypothetical protein